MARATSEAAFSSGRFTAAAPPSGAKQQWPAIRGAVGQLQKLVVPNEGQRGALLYVPATYSPGAPTPLILSLHGAGGDAQGGLSHLVGHADAFGCLLLSPQSKGSTWDMLRGGYGPDVAFINKALQQTFDQAASCVQYSVDPRRICASGFSDGASYALSLGVANGDLLTHMAAFSPGFMRPPATVGRPLVYISHGQHDRVLRIAYCSRRLVPHLEAAGYAVVYSEFDGPHTVPPSIAKEALGWFMGSRQAAGNSRRKE